MFLLLPLIAKADCSWLEKLSIKKFEKLPIKKITRIGGDFDANDICTFQLERYSNLKGGEDGMKISTSYLYKGEAKLVELIEHGSEWIYYKNGELYKKQDYVFGQLSGIVETYDIDGNLTEEIFYDNMSTGITKTSTKTKQNLTNIEKTKQKDNVEVKKRGASEIEVAKQKCANLGFTEKTEKFGICVLEILK